eukprot:SAG22_NODE_244_length_14023_cov_45.200661_8_plen_55_part_00
MPAADPANPVAIKMDDERYLRSKPELRWLVDKFVEVRGWVRSRGSQPPGRGRHR